MRQHCHQKAADTATDIGIAFEALVVLFNEQGIDTVSALRMLANEIASGDLDITDIPSGWAASLTETHVKKGKIMAKNGVGVRG